MKKGFIVLLVTISLVSLACATPGTSFSYPEPVLAADTAVFVGVGMIYAKARTSAIEKALAEGYTRILAETVEIEGVVGAIQVTVVMLK